MPNSTAEYQVHRFRADDQHFGHSLNTERLGHQLRFIDEYWKIVAKFGRFFRDRCTRILHQRIEHEEGHALRFKLIANLLQARHASLYDRTAIALNKDHNSLLIAVVAKLMELSLMI